MIDKKTVFILGAGASCPYGYPSGSRLRELICLDIGFTHHHNEYLRTAKITQPHFTTQEIQRFKNAFDESHIQSIDMFMDKNPKLAPIGKYIIAFEIFRAERKSCFGEKTRQRQEKRERSRSSSARDYILGTVDLLGGDWYSYLYNRLIEGLAGPKNLPDFSDGKLAFITFNYDRSLEHFLYESLCNSFTEVPKDDITQTMSQLKILHVYGQIMPLEWQDSIEGVAYKPPPINEQLLQSAASNIRTIYEEKQNPELEVAQNLFKQAAQIFFLGFGYAPENMEVLGLPGIIPPGNCRVCGTAFGLKNTEVERISSRIVGGLQPDHVGFKNSGRIVVKTMDSLELLRDYLN